MPIFIKALLFLLFFFVLCEPYTSDSLYYPFTLVVMATMLSAGCLSYPKERGIWIALLFYNVVYIVPLVFTIGVDLEASNKALRIIILLSLMTVFIAAVISRYGYEAIELAFNALTWFTLFSSLASLGALFGLLPIADQVMKWGRIMGFSEEVNYFGSAVQLAGMYAYYRIGTKNKIQKIKHLIFFALFAFIIFLTYSRAAWAALIVSIFFYSLFVAIQERSVSALLKFLGSITLGIIIIGVVWMVADSLGYTEFALQRFKLQDYDQERFFL